MSDLLLALLKSLATKVAFEELGSGCSAVARGLVKLSARWLIADKERYEEQWLADLEDRKTPLRKFLFSIGLLRAAAVLRRETRRVNKPRDESPWAPLEDWVFDSKVGERPMTYRKIGLSKGRQAVQNVYCDPVNLIDDSIESLTLLTDWLVEDLDCSPMNGDDSSTKDGIRALSALRAIRAALPRLRIVRSNFEASPILPDAAFAPPDAAIEQYVERLRAELRQLLRLDEGTSEGPADDPNDAGSDNGNRHDGTCS
jgi:hypothetical protein